MSDQDRSPDQSQVPGQKLNDDVPTARLVAGVDWRNFVLASLTVTVMVIALFIKWELSVYLVAVALVFVPVERILALNPQKIFRRGWWGDLAHIFSNGTFVAAALAAALAGGVWLATKVIPDSVPAAIENQVNLLPDEMKWLGPGILAIQAILIGEFFFYCAHRFAHENKYMWKFHALHHSIQEMDWLAAGRMHLVDQVFTRTATVLPVVVLFPPDTIAKYIVITGFQAFFLHSNIKVNFGPLKWIIGTPEFHHWHHADQKEAWNKNYSEQFPFMDKVFGTLYMPQDKVPQKYGIGTAPPKDLISQQVWSFQYLFTNKLPETTDASPVIAAKRAARSAEQAVTEESAAASGASVDSPGHRSGNK